MADADCAGYFLFVSEIDWCLEVNGKVCSGGGHGY